MKWKYFIIFLSLSLLLVSCQNTTTHPSKNNTSIEPQNVLPTEHFLRSYLLTSDGFIQTDLQQQKNVYLSESLGLWMLYLVEANNADDFDQQVKILQEHFLDPSNLVYWEQRGGKPSKVNAWIDDARIIRALYTASEVFHRKDYVELAKKMAAALDHSAYTGIWPVDYVDIVSKNKGDVLTISYIDSTAIEIFQQLNTRSSKQTKELMQWFREIPTKNNFFPKSFQISTKTFQYDEKINLIDQMYVAYHLEQAGGSTESFHQWMNEEFATRQKLVGQYDCQSREPVVDYESPAVYALAILYSVERGDKEEAIQYYHAMKALSVQDKELDEYGGYIDLDQQHTHSFDNLLPLLAERTLLNEGYIE